MEHVTLNATQWLIVIGFGAVLGATGQLVRMLPGLKKFNDEVAAKRADPRLLFSAARLVVSILLGALAGALGAITMQFDPQKGIELNRVISLIAIGYAGADFVEGFIQKYIPGSGAGTREVAAEVDSGATGDGAAKPPTAQAVG
jgi:hypothetical protein